MLRVWLGSEKGSGGVTTLVISLFVYMVGLAVLLRPFLGVVMVTTCDPLSCGGVPGVCSKGLARVRERVKGRVRGFRVIVGL